MFNSVIFHNFKWFENKCHPVLHVATDDDLPSELMFHKVKMCGREHTCLASLKGI